MNSSFFKNIIRFILLIAVQVVILNKIQFSGYFNPYVYVLFILMLPMNTPQWALLTLAFITGLVIDYFTGIMGVHAAASVFMAFCRPGIIKLFGRRDEFEAMAEPSLNTFGTTLFLTYAAMMVLCHHLVLFYLEVFRFEEFLMTLVRALVSSAFTLTMIMIVLFLFSKRK
jgi:rod shape-determining protein MreD